MSDTLYEAVLFEVNRLSDDAKDTLKDAIRPRFNQFRLLGMIKECNTEQLKAILCYCMCYQINEDENGYTFLCNEFRDYSK